MATIGSYLQQKKDDDDQQGSTTINTGSGGGVITGSGSGAKQSKGPASTGFVNFQSYLDANKDQTSKMQDTLVGAVRQGVQGAGAKVDQARQDATTTIKGLDQSGGSPYWRAEAEQKQSTIKQFNPYSDNYQKAVGEYDKAYQGVKSATTQGGKSDLLRDYLGKPSYTQGQLALDSALVGSDNTKFNQLASETQSTDQITQKFKDEVGKLQQQTAEKYNPARFEAKPDVAGVGYTPDLFNALATTNKAEGSLSAADLQRARDTLGGLQGLAAQNTGPKATEYLSQYLNPMAQEVAQQNYLFDRNAGRTQGKYDAGQQILATQAKGQAYDQQQAQTIEQSLGALQKYLGAGNLDSRAKGELQQYADQLRGAQSKNDQLLINSGLQSSGYDQARVNRVAQANKAGASSSMEDRVSMQRTLDSLQAARQQYGWDPEVSAALDEKINQVNAQLVQANQTSAFNGASSSIASTVSADLARTYGDEAPQVKDIGASDIAKIESGEASDAELGAAYWFASGVDRFLAQNPGYHAGAANQLAAYRDTIYNAISQRSGV